MNATRSKQKMTGSHRAVLTGAMILFLIGTNTSFAYDRYNDGCVDCHGAFNDSTTTKGSTFALGNKHDMHRYTMGTDCDLCHLSGDQKNPYMWKSNGTANNSGLGCTGCHVGNGLRAHHDANGVVECYDCHDPAASSAENVDPPYYGTVDTFANNACNDILASNTNENWTVGDFLGLDNDGDGLYDLADYSCGPLRLVEIVPEGNNIRVRWETAGGRAERIQATSVLTNGFSNIGTTVTIPGVGIVTQEVVEVSGAVDPVRFYRIRSIP